MLSLGQVFGSLGSSFPFYPPRISILSLQLPSIMPRSRLRLSRSLPCYSQGQPRQSKQGEYKVKVMQTVKINVKVRPRSQSDWGQGQSIVRLRSILDQGQGQVIQSQRSMTLARTFGGKLLWQYHLTLKSTTCSSLESLGCFVIACPAPKSSGCKSSTRHDIYKAITM